MSQQLMQAFIWPGYFVLLVCLTVSSEGSVQRLSPDSGSLCGGTRISIFGSGFAKNASANRVDIGDGDCKVESVTADKLVCRVPFRDDKVKSGKEKVVELVTVHADGEPLMMAKPLEFTFKAGDTPIIKDWGPATGQANDVLSFQGKEPLFGASVSLGGRECKAKYSEGNYYQCVPPAREAGLSNVEVDYGPDRGYACPSDKSQPLQFTYNLALQSAEPDDAEGAPELLTIVGQGLGATTVFKLCGGDGVCNLCIGEGPVTQDPPLYHGGDWSFQTAKCRPSPLDPSKALTLGGSRKCSLKAEGENGMFVSVVADAWTYTVSAAPEPVFATTKSPGLAAVPTAAPTVAPVHGSVLPAPVPTATPLAVAAPSASPASAPFVAASPAAPASAPAPGPAPGPPPTSAFLPPVASVPTAIPPIGPKRALKRMATKVLSKAFEKIADALSGGKRESQSLTETKGTPEQAALPPAHLPVFEPTPVFEPPPPIPPGLMGAAAPASAPAPGASGLAWLAAKDAKIVQLHSAQQVHDEELAEAATPVSAKAAAASDIARSQAKLLKEEDRLDRKLGQVGTNLV